MDRLIKGMSEHVGLDDKEVQKISDEFSVRLECCVNCQNLGGGPMRQ